MITHPVHLTVTEMDTVLSLRTEHDNVTLREDDTVIWYFPDHNRGPHIEFIEFYDILDEQKEHPLAPFNLILNARDGTAQVTLAISLRESRTFTYTIYFGFGMRHHQTWDPQLVVTPRNQGGR